MCFCVEESRKLWPIQWNQCVSHTPPTSPTPIWGHLSPFSQGYLFPTEKAQFSQKQKQNASFKVECETVSTLWSQLSLKKSHVEGKSQRTDTQLCFLLTPASISPQFVNVQWVFTVFQALLSIPYLHSSLPSLDLQTCITGTCSQGARWMLVPTPTMG